MAGEINGVTFSVPYELAVVRPLRQTTKLERQEVLASAHYNTELIPQEFIYIDLSTDSGVSARSTAQLAVVSAATAVEPGMGLASEGSRAYNRLAAQIQRYFGFDYFVPTTQGRSAERIWVKINVKPGSIVAGNMLFPSTRAHIEMAGAQIADVISDDAHDFAADEPFKGNIDIRKLEALVQEKGAGQISCVYVELSVNSCGGHPVSLANLNAVRQIASAYKIPLFLDACRILENSFLVQEREAAYRQRPLAEIVRETCALADGGTMSALKDLLVGGGGFVFTRDRASHQKVAMQSVLDGVQLAAGDMESIAVALPEIFASAAHAKQRVEQVKYLWHKLADSLPLVRPAAGHAVFIDLKKFFADCPAPPFAAEALAAWVYLQSGVRLTKGPPLAPSQVARGAELLRVAVPARKYLNGHMDDVAEALREAYAQRREIKGLKKIDDAARSKYDPAHFVNL
jgi:tyrosine phenol-lyase